MTDELIDVTASCHIAIDKEGNWFYAGNRIINEHVLAAFWQALERDPAGRYRIVMPPEVCYLEVADTPYVVAAIRGNPDEGITLILNNMSHVTLDPGGLVIGDNNVLYINLCDGERARFIRSAYYTLALMMEEDDQGRITLRVGDRIHTITT